MNQNYCELCGKKTDKLYKAEVLGGIMYVCEDCLKYGKKIDEPKKINNNKNNKGNKKTDMYNNSTYTFRKKSHYQETEESVIPNAVDIISKKLREENLNVNTFSRAIGEKESTISKILNKKLTLELQTAKKIEKFFKIKLTEEINVNYEDLEDNKDKEFTLGDYISK